MAPIIWKQNNCLYETTINVLIRAFMYIVIYKLWLTCCYTGEGFNSISLKSNIVVRRGDPKLLAHAVKSFPWAQDFNTMNCSLEVSKLFGSTKQKLNLSPGANWDSQQSNKVNYSFPCPNIRAKMICIEEFVILCKAWCGVYHIDIKDRLSFFPLAYCKISTQLCQKILDF